MVWSGHAAGFMWVIALGSEVKVCTAHATGTWFGINCGMTGGENESSHNTMSNRLLLPYRPRHDNNDIWMFGRGRLGGGASVSLDMGG